MAVGNISLPRDDWLISPNGSALDAGADVIARRQLTQVERRAKRLHTLKKELKRIVTECDGNCVAESKIIEFLCDHSECMTEHQEVRVRMIEQGRSVQQNIKYQNNNDGWPKRQNE